MNLQAVKDPLRSLERIIYYSGLIRVKSPVLRVFR